MQKINSQEITEEGYSTMIQEQIQKDTITEKQLRDAGKINEAEMVKLRIGWMNAEISE